MRGCTLKPQNVARSLLRYCDFLFSNRGLKSDRSLLSHFCCAVAQCRALPCGVRLRAPDAMSDVLVSMLLDGEDVAMRPFETETNVTTLTHHSIFDRPPACSGDEDPIDLDRLSASLDYLDNLSRHNRAAKRVPLT